MRSPNLVRSAFGTALVAGGLIASGVLGGSAAHASSVAWSAPSAIPGSDSGGAPAIAAYRGVLYAVWIGSASPVHILYSHYNGKTWAKQAEVPSAVAAPFTGVGLAVYNGSLYVAWEFDGPSSYPIFYSAFNGSTWTPETNVPSALTYQYAYPALAAYDGNLYVEFYNSNGTHVAYSAFNGATWTHPADIPSATGPGPALQLGPALTVYEGDLFATWTPPACCTDLAYARFNGATWTSPGSFAANHEANAGLTSAVFDNVLYEGWNIRSSAAPEPVAYTTYNGNWLATEEVPSANSLFAPGLAAPFHGSLVVAWTNSGSGNTGPIDISSGP
jgi:hypothetical protein